MGFRLRSPRRPLRSLVFVFVHPLRTMLTPNAIRTRTTPDAARSRPMHKRFGGGVQTPSPIRRRATSQTGYPWLSCVWGCQGLQGHLGPKDREPHYTHARLAPPALPSPCLGHTLEVHEAGRQGAHTSRGGPGPSLACPPRRWARCPRAYICPSACYRIVPYTLCVLAHRLHVIYVTASSVEGHRM